MFSQQQAICEWLYVLLPARKHTRLANRRHPEVTAAECLVAEFKLAPKESN